MTTLGLTISIVPALCFQTHGLAPVVFLKTFFHLQFNLLTFHSKSVEKVFRLLQALMNMVSEHNNSDNPPCWSKSRSLVMTEKRRYTITQLFSEGDRAVSPSQRGRQLSTITSNEYTFLICLWNSFLKYLYISLCLQEEVHFSCDVSSCLKA